MDESYGAFLSWSSLREQYFGCVNGRTLRVWDVRKSGDTPLAAAQLLDDGDVNTIDWSPR